MGLQDMLCSKVNTGPEKVGEQVSDGSEEQPGGSSTCGTEVGAYMLNRRVIAEEVRSSIKAGGPEDDEGFNSTGLRPIQDDRPLVVGEGSDPKDPRIGWGGAGRVRPGLW